MSKHHAIYIKYTQLLLVNYTSIKLGRKVLLYCKSREPYVAMTDANRMLSLGHQFISHCLYQWSRLWPVGAVSGPSVTG